MSLTRLETPQSVLDGLMERYRARVPDVPRLLAALKAERVTFTAQAGKRTS